MYDNSCTFANMTDLKKSLLDEIKREEWRKSIDDDEYKNTTKLVGNLYKENLANICQRNKFFKYKKIKGKKPQISKNISEEAQQAYEEWKKNNPKENDCPEVSVLNLLLLLYYLDSEPDKNNKRDVHACLRRQNSEFETFWDSPTYILRLLRKCVYTRDWNNMTYFSLILLNYDRKYLHIIKNMCKIMVKYNPLIEECGFTEQFQSLFQTREQLTVV